MPGPKRRSVDKQKIICGQCKLQIMDDEDSIQCDLCEKTLHSMCTKLDKRQFEKLVNNTSLEYKCHICNNDSEQSSLSNDLHEIKTRLKQLDQLEDITTTIQFMSSQYDSILKGVAENKKKLDYLQNENKVLREEVHYLKSSVKFLNDNRVKNDCIINGYEVKNGEDENATEVVINIAKKIGADISVNQVEDAYFLPIRNKSTKKSTRRSIIVKFGSKIQKQKFMAEKSKLKGDESLKSVYINDLLCKESMDLFNYAKSVKSVGYKYVFTKESKVFVKKDDQSHVVFIKNMDDIDKILLRAAERDGPSTSRRKQVNIASEDASDCEENNAFMSPN